MITTTVMPIQIALAPLDTQLGYLDLPLQPLLIPPTVLLQDMLQVVVLVLYDLLRQEGFIGSVFVEGRFYEQETLGALFRQF